MPRLDLGKMAATRVPRGALPVVPARAPAPPPKLSRLLAEICVLAVRGDKCLICGGASWVGPHEDECPAEKAMAAISKNGWLREDGLHVNMPAHVTRAPGGGIQIYGVPYERYIHLDLDQRDDIRARHEKSRRFKVLRLKCQWCERTRHEVRPPRKGQAPEECGACFRLRAMEPEALKRLIQSNVAEAKAHAARGFKHSAKWAADRAKLAMKILRGA